MREIYMLQLERDCHGHFIVKALSYDKMISLKGEDDEDNFE